MDLNFSFFPVCVSGYYYIHLQPMTTSMHCELLTIFECLYIMASSQAILVISSRLFVHLGEPSKLNKGHSLSIFLHTIVCLVTENTSECRSINCISLHNKKAFH